MKYYYVKDGVLRTSEEDYIVVFSLLSSNDIADFPQVVVDSCVVRVNKSGPSSIAVEWHDKAEKHNRIISEESNDAFIIRSSSPIYRIGKPWASFLPSGKWPVALEVEYAVDKRTSTIKAVTRNRVNVTSH